MALLKTLAELQSWETYRTYTKDRLKLLSEGVEPFLVTKEKLDFDIKGKPWRGTGFLFGEKGDVYARKLKAEGIKFIKGTMELEGKTIKVTGIPGSHVKRARLTLKKFVLGYKLFSTDDPEGNEDDDEGAAPPPPGAAAIDAPSLEQRLKAIVKAVKEATTVDPEEKQKLVLLITKVKDLIGADNIELAARALDKLEGMITGVLGSGSPPPAATVAVFDKLGYDETKAAAMAKRAQALQAKGYDAKRAVTCAIVHQDMIDEGVSAEAAEQLSNMSVTKGTATVADARSAAREMAKFPAPMLKVMADNGATIVSCRGSVTDAMPELAGVKPRGWPEGMTWDSVPGLYKPDTNEVLLATKGTDRHVAANGEGHGAADLAGHEGGHCFDEITGSRKSDETAFVNARQEDIDRLAEDGKNLGAYFMQSGKVGPQETFAESCALYFGKHAKMKTEWKSLHKFFATNPYGS